MAAAAKPSRRHKAEGSTRRCIVTGAERPPGELIRFVLGPDSEVVADVDERLPGRGFWLSPERDVVNTALAKRAFAKAARAKVAVPEGLADRVEALLAVRCRKLIGLARRAGDAVAGFEKVRAGLKDGRNGALLLVAADASPDSARKIKGPARGADMDLDRDVVEVLTADELADAFGTERTVHVLVAGGNLAAAIRQTAAKLAGFRKRGDADAGEEWNGEDQDGPNGRNVPTMNGKT